MREIQSLARGLKILEILSGANDTVGVTTLANALRIDKGSASLLLQTLANYGFSEKDPVSKQYRLGPALVRLSRSLLTKMPLRETARPFLLRLVQYTGECAHLGIYSEGKVLYIDQVESPHTLRVNTEVGFTAPLHCTALGKVLLAWTGTNMPSNLERFTENTIVDAEKLHHDLEIARNRGYALDEEEFTKGVRCIAAPVMDFRGLIIGALGISGPSSRVTEAKINEMAQLVTSISKELSKQMGS